MNAEPDSTGVGSSSGASSASETVTQIAMTASRTSRITPELAITHRARAPSNGIADHSANALPIARPVGTASTKPALAPGMTTRGVANAWSPRNAAAEMNDIDTRKRRASARRRADAPTDQPRAAAIAAAPRTSQKCDGWWSQCGSVDGAARSSARPAIGVASATTSASTIALGMTGLDMTGLDMTGSDAGTEPR